MAGRHTSREPDRVPDVAYVRGPNAVSQHLVPRYVGRRLRERRIVVAHRLTEIDVAVRQHGAVWVNPELEGAGV